MTTIVFEGRIKTIARKLGNSLWRLTVGCFRILGKIFEYLFRLLILCLILVLIVGLVLGWIGL